MANPDPDKAAANNTPENRLLAMMLGVAGTQLIGLAAQLDIPDLLNDGSKSIDALAEATDTRKPALLQVMHALAALEVSPSRDQTISPSPPLANCCEPTCRTPCEDMPSWWRAA